MEFLKFMENYKNKEIKKTEIIKILKDNFENINIDDKEEYSFIISVNKHKYVIDYTYKYIDENDDNIIILDSYKLQQALPLAKL